MNPTLLNDALARCREQGLAWEPVYDQFVAQLRAGGVGSGAPGVGERIAPFALPDSLGMRRQLADLIVDGPLVLSFNRGGWCPYCRTELSAWVDWLPVLAAHGARFAAVTGEVGGRAERLRAELCLDADMLCDVDHGLALGLGLAFHAGAELRRRYLDCGLDLAEAYGTPGWLLPIPATFVIDTDATVRFAFVEPDFRLRAEPAEIVELVADLVRSRRN